MIRRKSLARHRRRVVGARRFRAIRPGGYFTCGLTTTDQADNGRGDNRNGQVGDGTTVLRRVQPVKVAGALDLY